MQEAPPIRNVLADELFNERVRTFREFLDNDYGENVNRDKILKMILTGNKRLVVNIKHVRSFNQEYAAGLLSEPVDFLPAFDKALRDVIASVGNPNADPDTLYSIGLEGSFGDSNISPRNLSSFQLGKLICIEGIVSRCSLVRPKVAKSVHYCEVTQMFHSREYRDQTYLGHSMPTGSTYPKEDENGNPLTTEFGLSTYRGTQTISIQEMPERAPPGQLPRPVDVILDHDLSDFCKPGDRVQIIGVYRSMGKHAASTSAVFKTMILANNIKQLGKTINKFNLSDADCDEIKHIASKRKDIFEVLSRSLAPSIYGHDYIKKAVLLQMLGGVEKNLDNGTHIRGDINILMIGDPSTAKSQMLRFILNIAPLAIATTGRGSSGVGLTAAVTTDRDTGERKLEAGAMVLADRGVVCIDEFDKMSDIDRVAIHEVMEQQTVTIAKAGIHTSLNARCSVIAAANPVMGQYVDTKEPSKNINLPDSLLSRFDLLFVVLDNLEDEHNRRIAEHVVRLHRYNTPGHEEGVPIDENNCLSFNTYTSAEVNDEEETAKVSIYEKYNQLLHFGHSKPKKSKKSNKSTVPDGCVDLFTIAFIRKYIQYAKSKVSPTLTEEASAMISNQYTELRAWEDGRERKYRVMPITPRTLETLIRLSTAHAKARLSLLVEESDVEVAVELLEYALYKEVKRKPSKRAKIEKPYDSSDSDSSDDEDSYKKDKVKTKERARRASRKPVAADSMDLDEGDDDDNEAAMKNLNLTTTGFEASQSNSAQPNLSSLISSSASSSQNKSQTSSIVSSNPERIKLFERALNECREEKGNAQELSLDEFIAHLSNTDFQMDEIVTILRKMSVENRIWFREDENEILFM